MDLNIEGKGGRWELRDQGKGRKEGRARTQISQRLSASLSPDDLWQSEDSVKVFKKSRYEGRGGVPNANLPTPFRQRGQKENWAIGRPVRTSVARSSLAGKFVANVYQSLNKVRTPLSYSSPLLGRSDAATTSETGSPSPANSIPPRHVDGCSTSAVRGKEAK